MDGKTVIKRLVQNVLPASLGLAIRKRHFLHNLQSAQASDEPDLLLVTELAKASLFGAGDFVLDVGANYGLYTKILSGIVGPQGKVVGVEPIGRVFTVLQNSVKKLGLSNVTLVNAAASDAPGTAQMVVPYGPDGMENLYQSTLRTESGMADSSSQFAFSETVEVTTIDTICGADASRLRFAKVDVEGAELSTLRGASGVLALGKCAWLVEIAGDPAEAGTTAAQVFQLFESSGYTPFCYDGKTLNRYKAGAESINYFFFSAEHVQKLREATFPIV